LGSFVCNDDLFSYYYNRIDMLENKIEVLNDAFRAITQRLGIRNAVMLSRCELHNEIQRIDPQSDALFREYMDVFMEYAINPVPENQIKKDTVGLRILNHLNTIRA